MSHISPDDDVAIDTGVDQAGRGSGLETRREARQDRHRLEVRLSWKLLAATAVTIGTTVATATTAWVSLKNQVTALQAENAQIREKLHEQGESNVRMWNVIQTKRDRSDR